MSTTTATKRKATKGPKGAWLRGVMEEFYAARAQWEADLENETGLYETEMKEWIAKHPRPQLREFMVQMAWEFCPLCDAHHAGSCM